MAAAIIWKSTMGISRRYAEEVKSSLTLIFSRRIRYLPTSLQDIRQSLFSAECITINGSVRIL